MCPFRSKASSARGPLTLGKQEEAHGMAPRRFAFDATPKRIPFDAPKSGTHFAETGGIAFDTADRHIELAGVLDSVQLIRTGLHGQGFAVGVGAFPIQPGCSPGLS